MCVCVVCLCVCVCACVWKIFNTVNGNTTTTMITIIPKHEHESGHVVKMPNEAVGIHVDDDKLVLLKTLFHLASGSSFWSRISFHISTVQ